MSDSHRAPASVLLRGLSIIEALNARQVSSVDDVARETCLPKPTVVRMLSQLAAHGYCERLPFRRGYRLSDRVQALSAGYRSIDTLVAIARPLLTTFTAQHKWPLTLAILDTDAMRVRASTLAESPYATSLDQGRMARRLPVLTSAVGLAQLAFCPDDERDTLLRLVRTTRSRRGASTLDEDRLQDLLRDICGQGYATSPVVRGEMAKGLAVPIMQGERVLGAISLRYLGKAISEAQVARRYLHQLQAMATQIGTALAAHANASGSISMRSNTG